MNTLGHVVFNLLAVGRGRGQPWAPILAGALLPDLPMLVMYAVERGLLGTSELLIWRERYFAPGWQLFVDAFNSLPLIAAGWFLARRRGSPFLRVMFLSMGVHAGVDLLVHHDDAHRHFLPFSDWRFVSPVSYWDPRHFGQLFLAAEMTMVVVGSGYLAVRGREKAVRRLGAATLVTTAHFVGFALWSWSDLPAP